MYSTKIILDSISPAGRRLTTWELTYPRFVHAELMTHRLFSRNSASSRAIPNEKLRKRIQEDPALPIWWGKNQAGMQAREELSGELTACAAHAADLTTRLGGNRGDCEDCQGLTAYGSPLGNAMKEWIHARDLMLEASENLARHGLHKQLCNRLLEPWMFITVICSSTSFDNWYHLRDHWQAQPEIAWVAHDMHEKSKASTPQVLQVGEWHLPLVYLEEHVESDVGVIAGAITLQQKIDVLKKISVGRVARVSYLTHDGKRDVKEDVALHDRLLAGRENGDPLHMSPFEHVACALEDPNAPSGNFRGWGQYRKEIPGEHHGEVLP